MRVSDAERQRAVDELRRHCADGRLDVDEYASRLERAMAATTLEELDSLRSDLPMLRIAPPNGARPLTPMRSPEGNDPTARFAAVTIVLVAIAVVIGAIVLTLAASWVWAVVLVVGWGAGRLQGSLRTRRPG